MNPSAFARLSQRLLASMKGELRGAVVVEDRDGSYRCTSWQLKGDSRRELFIELTTDGTFRAGLYFKDAQGVTSTSAQRREALAPVLIQRPTLRKLLVVPTFTGKGPGRDHEPFGWSDSALRRWLTGLSDHRDLVRRFSEAAAPKASVVREVLVALAPIWRQWNEIARPRGSVGADEGARRFVAKEIGSRNSRLIGDARAFHGLHCKVCGFLFEEVYGDLGTGFIEIHHLRPVAKGRRRTALIDLAPVCANCHRMLHRGRRVLSLVELKAHILAASKVKKPQA